MGSAMPEALRTTAPRPKPCEAGFPASAKSERDEAPLTAGAAAADPFKVFRAPGRILPWAAPAWTGLQADMTRPATNETMAVLTMLLVKSALPVQPAGGLVLPVGIFLPAHLVMVLRPLRCCGLGTKPCANIANAPCGDCIAQFRWSWERAPPNLAPQRGSRKRQGRRQVWTLGIANQLGQACIRCIGQLIKTWDCVGHAVRDGLAGLAWLVGDGLAGDLRVGHRVSFGCTASGRGLRPFAVRCGETARSTDLRFCQRLLQTLYRTTSEI